MHIGIKQKRREGFRYKRLHNSGIFEGRDTLRKANDCQGPFENWSNTSARKWIYARVKEQKEGRKVHIVCDCCDTREFDIKNLQELIDRKIHIRINQNCYGGELVELISHLAKTIAKY